MDAGRRTTLAGGLPEPRQPVGLDRCLRVWRDEAFAGKVKRAIPLNRRAAGGTGAALAGWPGPQTPR